MKSEFHKKMIKYKKEIAYESLIAPALLIFCLFVIYPAFDTVLKSFTNWNDMNAKGFVYKEHFVWLENYRKLMKDKSVITAIKNSFEYALLATVFQSICGLLLALVLSSKVKGRKFFRAVWYFPAVLSALIIGYLWNKMLSTSDYGLVNQWLKLIGFQSVNFLGNARIAMKCIIFVSVWQWSGWTMTIYLANLMSIPSELKEAAAIDGAGKIKNFWSITFPLLFPSISYCIIVGMISGLKVYDIVYALTGGGPAGGTNTIISFMMSKGFTEGFYGYTSAIGTVFLAIVLIITAIQMKYFEKWGDNIS